MSIKEKTITSESSRIINMHKLALEKMSELNGLVTGIGEEIYRGEMSMLIKQLREAEQDGNRDWVELLLKNFHEMSISLDELRKK